MGPAMQRFCKEIVAWKMLRHPNVMPVIGVTMTENRFVTVSEWMNNGNITEYLEGGNGNRLELVFILFRLFIAPLVINDSVIVAARRRYKGTNLFTRPGGSPRKPQGGRCSNLSRLPVTPAYETLSPIS